MPASPESRFRRRRVRFRAGRPRPVISAPDGSAAGRSSSSPEERAGSAPPSASSRRGAGAKVALAGPRARPARRDRRADRPRRPPRRAATSPTSTRSRPPSPAPSSGSAASTSSSPTPGSAPTGRPRRATPRRGCGRSTSTSNGAYRTIHATLPHVLERRGYIGVVCSIASFAPLAGMSSYSASKAGAESLVRAVRQEVGFRGVDVGAIHPSWIDTDLVRESELDLAELPRGPREAAVAAEVDDVGGRLRAGDRRRLRAAQGAGLRAAGGGADLLAADADHERRRRAGDERRRRQSGCRRWSARSPRSAARRASGPRRDQRPEQGKRCGGVRGGDVDEWDRRQGLRSRQR